MSSDSESSLETPDDKSLEAALLRVVVDALEGGEADDLTVNSVRAQAAKALRLDSDFFNSDTRWKSRSKEIIKEAVGDPEAARASLKTSAASNGTKKRKANSDARPIKRRKSAPKQQSPVESSSESADIEVAAEPTKPSAPRSHSSRLPDSSDESEGSASDKRGAPQADDSDSMSDVKDETPRKKKRGRPAGSTTSKTKEAKPSKTAAAKAAKDADLSPDQQEVKKLQGWLLKCGIRKLWHRELADCDTDKAKIKHLKKMLEDVGMTGRYSAEKASAIKEQRELAADLEAVQEGNKQWGKSSGSESESGARPRRRGVAARFVDFGDDEDDE